MGKPWSTRFTAAQLSGSLVKRAGSARAAPPSRAVPCRADEKSRRSPAPSPATENLGSDARSSASAASQKPQATADRGQ
eukprot:scaffold11792_cov112-Isochrysis_galbana.AAC.2